jgi:hypothetical protein
MLTSLAEIVSLAKWRKQHPRLGFRLTSGRDLIRQAHPFSQGCASSARSDRMKHNCPLLSTPNAAAHFPELHQIALTELRELAAFS